MHTGEMASRYGVNVETDSSTISATGTGLKQEDTVGVAPPAPAPAPPAAPVPAPAPALAAPLPVAAAGPPSFSPPHLPPVAPPPGGFTFGPATNANANPNAGGINAAATAAAAAALAAPMPSAFPSLTKKVAPVKKKKVKYCKAPGAPKRFKSAFIFFTMHRHKTIRKEIEEKLGKGDRTPDVAKIISEEWRNMKPEDRAVWDEKARLDKERFEVEKALYTGPWKIPVKQKSQKDPGAPKRPMSSFLSYSNSKRSEIKRTHPGISNSDASKLLAKMWKEAPYEEKREHIEREERLREIYKREIAEYRNKKKNDIEEVREEREKAALRYIDNRAKGIIDESELLSVSWGPNDGSNNGTNPEQGHYPPHGAYDGAPYGDPYYSHPYHHGPPPPHGYHGPPPPHGYHGGPPPPPHYYSAHGQPPPPHYAHVAHQGEGRDAPPPPPHGHFGYYDDGYGGYAPQHYHHHHHPPAPVPGQESGAESVAGDAAKGVQQGQAHGHPPAEGAPPPMDHGAGGYYYDSNEHPPPPVPPLDGHHYDGGYSEHYGSQQPPSQDAPPVY